MLFRSISCRPVIADSEIDTWTLRKLDAKAKQTERLARLAAEENPLREILDATAGRTKRGPIVGGIEVGAKTVVGSEGKVIKKTVIAGGGEVKYLGTIATSKGFIMNKEDMKKLGVDDATEVTRWKDKLAKTTGSRPWKLVLVETARGREFRWIVDPDDDEDEETGEKTEKAEKGKKGKKGKKSGSEGGRAGKEKGSTQGRTRGKEAKKDKEEEFDEHEEGSEEVYKDEL